MTTMLTDDELDTVLTGAATRLHSLSADVPLGAAPSPSFPTTTVLRIAAAVVVVGGATAGVLAVNRGGGDGVPAAFTRGDFGTEVVQREQDDGDGDRLTRRVVLEPGGQTFRVLSGAAAAAYGAGGDPDQTCFDFGDQGATCGTALVPSMDLSGSRGPGTVALVRGIPGDVVAVAFEAGAAVRAWARPVDGTAAFPYPVTGESTATATLVRADGTAVDVLEAVDATPTEAERVTQPTAEVLVSPRVVERPPTGFVAGTAYVRTRGRIGARTGFSGPFVLQTFVGGASGRRSTVEVLTVNEGDAEDARVRLRPNEVVGGLRLEDAANGVVTLVWAGANVDDDTMRAFVDGLRPGTAPTDAIDLDASWSWAGTSDRSMYRFLDSGTIGALLFDRVAFVTLDGVTRQVWAGGDDGGAVTYWVESLDGTAVDIGRGVEMPGVPPRLPAVGERLAPGLWVLPPSLKTLTITLDDGTTVEPQLVDILRTSGDTKLAILPAAVEDHLVAAVSST